MSDLSFPKLFCHSDLPNIPSHLWYWHNSQTLMVLGFLCLEYREPWSKGFLGSIKPMFEVTDHIFPELRAKSWETELPVSYSWQCSVSVLVVWGALYSWEGLHLPGSKGSSSNDIFISKSSDMYMYFITSASLLQAILHWLFLRTSWKSHVFLKISCHYFLPLSNYLFNCFFPINPYS